MALNVTVHRYFDDGTETHIPLYDFTLKKHRANNGMPVYRFYLHNKPEEPVFTVHGKRDYIDNKGIGFRLGYSTDIGPCRLPTDEERDQDYKNWCTTDKTPDVMYCARYALESTLEVNGTVYTYDSLLAGGYSDILLLQDQDRVEKALAEITL